MYRQLPLLCTISKYIHVYTYVYNSHIYPVYTHIDIPIYIYTCGNIHGFPLSWFGKPLSEQHSSSLIYHGILTMSNCIRHKH